MLGIVIVILLTACNSSGFVSDSNGEAEENIHEGYDTLFTCTYPKSFKSKRSNTLKKLKNINGKELTECDAYLEIEKKFFQENSYKQTLKKAEYQYFGELKNNRPHGKGILLQAGWVIYAGNFKEGRYSGYGMSFDGYHIIEEGEYKNGVLSGDGIVYYKVGYTSESSILEKYNDEIFDSKIVNVDFPMSNPSVKMEGSFKKGKANGSKFKVYYSNYDTIDDLKKTSNENYGTLKYEGEMDDGKMDGKGKLFYPNGQLAYNGKFKDDKYHGDGILYNKDGSVKYKGEFKDGDAK